MCGIAGFWLAGNSPIQDPRRILSTMGSSMTHRGPDAWDLCWHEHVRLGMVHRRLSIQDLSPLGAQPMTSSSGRFTIVFNGEIYNFRSLRQELKGAGHLFRGGSDTEVMLQAFEAWGVEEALDRFRGMFAFALWDRGRGRLWLARDRMGEKPLYYGWLGNTLLFASELKALRAFPGFNAAVNFDVLGLFLRHNYIPAPYSIYQGIFKLLPAHFICYDLADPALQTEPFPYWSLDAALSPSPEISEDTVVDELERCLGDAIEEQMVADVPLGAFLSGGIDSSTVVALMQSRARDPVRTFSIGFDEPEFNEAPHAAAVASFLGTNHTELYVASRDGLALIPDLQDMFDEPFADPSQVPTHLVSRLTREHVTVSLSGDGADELFAGYGRYSAALRLWRRSHQPPGLRQRLENLGLALPDALAVPAARLARPSAMRFSRRAMVEKLQRERQLRANGQLQGFYRDYVSFWGEPEKLAPGVAELAYALSTPPTEKVVALDPMHQLMWYDLNTYLPDDILAKVDRAAMAVSLETRVPFLDRRVVEFALGIPAEWNTRYGETKRVLRHVLYRHIPRELVDRPKRGFAIPLGNWLRTSLKEWAEELLSVPRLDASGCWNTSYVRQVWADHLDGVDDFSFKLWSILTWQAWLDSQRASATHCSYRYADASNS